MMAATPMHARVVAGAAGVGEPMLTVAVPHYNHRRYAEVALESVLAQDLPGLEIVVSDDGSSDDSAQVLPAILQRAGHPFRYFRQERNLGYDVNVRFCLASARGRYVFLLGNDDALAGPHVLAEIVSQLQSLRFPAVAFTNYEDWGTGVATVRATRTCDLGAGPDVAAGHFRNFSFVSGLIFDRAAAAAHETSRWDSSVFYQIFLACRIVAAGGHLATLAITAVRKDIQVEGRKVGNYESRWAKEGWSFAPRHTGLDSVAAVTADAILPLVPPGRRGALARRIGTQIILFSYLHWLLEYRRVVGWPVAVGVARGARPARSMSGLPVSPLSRMWLRVVYAAVTVAGLTLPRRLGQRVGGRIAGLARRLGQSADRHGGARA